MKMPMTDKRQESDLYQPIKIHLQTLGYEVKGEIKDCDIVAKKDEKLVIIELKLSLNITLLLQAVDRFSLSDTVYIAVPKQCGIYKKQSTVNQYVRYNHPSLAGMPLFRCMM